MGSSVPCESPPKPFAGVALSRYQKVAEIEAPDLISSGKLFSQESAGLISKLVEEADFSGKVAEPMVFHKIASWIWNKIQKLFSRIRTCLIIIIAFIMIIIFIK